MQIAAITGVKNESDIIESFVRQNARYIDHFYFVDDSVDNTPAILANLSQEGYKITKINLDTRDYQHSQVMTSVTRHINSQGNYDWIFYLDADEIIYCPTKESFSRMLEENANRKVGVARHLEFAANEKFYFDSLNPLKECFNVRSHQSQTNKIFIRGDQFDKVIINPGQHSVFNTDRSAVDYFDSRLQFGHYPVRSAAQYLTRSIIIYASLVAKLNKIPNEGSHAVRQYEWLKQRGFIVTQKDVTEWGLRFGLEESAPVNSTLTEHKPAYLDDISCKYLDLCQRNDTMLLALELERVANLLSDFRHKTYGALQTMKSLF